MNLRPITSSLCIALIAGTAAAQPEYECILVDAFTTSTTLRETYLRDINEQGYACGTTLIETTLPGGSTSVTYTGFYWSPTGGKVAIDLDGPQSINDLGQIGGSGGIYDVATGQITWVPLLPGTASPLPLYGINNDGLAVGYVQTCSCSNSQGLNQVPYLWDPVNGARSIPLPGAKELMAVNRYGVAAGNMREPMDSFVYDSGTGSVTRLNALQGPNTNSKLFDISDTGVVVGEGWNGAVIRPFIWSASGGFVDLPTLPGVQPRDMHPKSVNSDGVVVGSTLTPAGWPPHAFIWDSARGTRDLNDLCDAPPDFTLAWAARINDAGWIVGYGQGNGAFVKAFVLKPIAPPCYANCDGSTTAPVLNVLDFSCFLNNFAAGDTHANCDASTAPPVLNVLDFGCFLNRFAAGCP